MQDLGGLLDIWYRYPRIADLHLLCEGRACVADGFESDQTDMDWLLPQLEAFQQELREARNERVSSSSTAFSQLKENEFKIEVHNVGEVSVHSVTSLRKDSVPGHQTSFRLSSVLRMRPRCRRPV